MATTKQIHSAAQYLKQGGLVAFPTETVYGLGADAFNKLAVARIFEVKNRPSFDPLIVHIAERSQVRQVARGVPLPAVKLADHFWPGPLTLVLPRHPNIPDIVTAGLDTVGVRIPDHDVALQLLRACGRPVAAPSANLFGSASPTTAEHVREQLGDKVDVILDGGPCRVGIESTVVAFENGIEILRLGGLTVEEIEEVVGDVRVRQPGDSPPQAPGMLARHYAPATPLVLAENKPDLSGKRVGLLRVQGFTKPKGDYAVVETLSKLGDLREAAAALFAAMRDLDKAGLDLIVAELAPEQGLGRAINDRLRRAAAPT